MYWVYIAAQPLIKYSFCRMIWMLLLCQFLFLLCVIYGSARWVGSPSFLPCRVCIFAVTCCTMAEFRLQPSQPSLAHVARSTMAGHAHRRRNSWKWAQLFGKRCSSKQAVMCPPHSRAFPGCRSRGRHGDFWQVHNYFRPKHWWVEVQLVLTVNLFSSTASANKSTLEQIVLWVLRGYTSPHTFCSLKR